MKAILYLKGMKYSSKNHFIKNNRLSDHLISKKDIRKMISGFEYSEDGIKRAYQKFDEQVDFIAFKSIELRMIKGDFLVYDPEGPNNRNLNRLIKLSEKYGYVIYIVDFEEKGSDRFDIIQEDANLGIGSLGSKRLNRQFEDMMNIHISKSSANIKYINTWDYPKVIKKESIDLSSYKKIHHIGDLHGNYRLLQKYLKGIKDDEFYIFHGDFIDGGPDSGKVIDYISSIANKKNVVIIRGNHEKSLDKLIKGQNTGYEHFETVTKPKIMAINQWRDKVELILENLRDVFVYNYKGIEVIASHGGVSTYTKDLFKISSESFINGMGGKRNTSWICQTFEKSVKGRPIYQVFGHRSTNNKKEFRVCNNNFNINGDSEKYKNFLKAIIIKKGYNKGFSRLNNDIFYRQVYIEEKYFNKYTKKDAAKKTE